MVKLGRYRHYKGGIYNVIAVGLLESNHEPMVVYMSEEESGEFPAGSTWIRAEKEFAEVMDDGRPRFQYLLA